MITKVDRVNTGTAEGYLLKEMPSPPNVVEFRYNYTDHADIDRDLKDFLVLCHVGGVPVTGEKMVLHHCRPVGADEKPRQT